MFNFNSASNEKTLRELRADYKTKIEKSLVTMASDDLKAETTTRDVAIHTVAVVVKGYNPQATSEDVRQAVEAAIDAEMQKDESWVKAQAEKAEKEEKRLAAIAAKAEKEVNKAQNS